MGSEQRSKWFVFLINLHYRATEQEIQYKSRFIEIQNIAKLNRIKQFLIDFNIKIAMEPPSELDNLQIGNILFKPQKQNKAAIQKIVNTYSQEGLLKIYSCDLICIVFNDYVIEKLQEKRRSTRTGMYVSSKMHNVRYWVDWLASINKWKVNKLSIFCNFCQIQQQKIEQFKRNVKEMPKIIVSINFQNLQQLSLTYQYIDNIQFLLFINCDEISRLDLSQNKIRSVKPLNKLRLKRTHHNGIYQRKFNSIYFYDNLISQFQLNRLQIKFFKNQCPQFFKIIPPIRICTNSQSQIDVRCIIKAQYLQSQCYKDSGSNLYSPGVVINQKFVQIIKKYFQKYR